MTKNTLIGRSNFRVPYRVWELGGTHPFKNTHTILPFDDPSGQINKYLQRSTVYTTYDTWLKKGLDIGDKLVSLDSPVDDHVVSIPMQLGLMRTSLRELADKNADFSFRGGSALAVAMMFIDGAYHSDTLSEPVYPGMVSQSGLRVAPTIISHQTAIPNDTKADFEYENILNWVYVLRIFTRLAVRESQGKLDAYKGLRGQIRFAEESEIQSLNGLRLHARSMGLVDELDWWPLDLSLKDLSAFNIDYIVGFIEKARENQIGVLALMEQIAGKSQAESEAHLNALIAKKIAVLNSQEERRMKAVDKKDRAASSRSKSVTHADPDRLKKPSNVVVPQSGGVRKDSTEQFYYEYKKWCADEGLAVALTIIDFIGKFEGLTREDWEKAFKGLKRTIVNERKRRIYGSR